MSDFDVSHTVDQWFDANDEPKLPSACVNCPIRLGTRDDVSCCDCSENPNREYESPWDVYATEPDGEYACDGCGELTPACGDATLILCPKCQARSNILMP